MKEIRKRSDEREEKAWARIQKPKTSARTEERLEDSWGKSRIERKGGRKWERG